MSRALSPTPLFGYHVRHARSEEAQVISELYVRAYTPDGGGDARNHYPFPQFLEAAGVAAAIEGGEIVWLVAEADDGTVIGSAGAVRNIGNTRDRVAEVFGIVVASGCRLSGVGTALLRRIVVELDDSADFILCEARTAEPGGWKVADNAGFVPIGYQPYAHAMPIGYESMILTARGPWDGQHFPVPDVRLVGAARRLAQTVVHHAMSEGRAEPVRPDHESMPTFEVRRDDAADIASLASLFEDVNHGSGIVGFHPLKGVDHDLERSESLVYVARDESEVVGWARVNWDRIDARARVLEVRASNRVIATGVLKATVRALESLAAEQHFVLLVTVCADLVPIVDDMLLTAGFVPTAYLPRLIATADGRGDAVQYTRVLGWSLQDSVIGVTAMAWPRACAVVEQIVGNGTPSA